MRNRIRKYYPETYQKWYAKNKKRLVERKLELLSNPKYRARRNELHRIRMLYWRARAIEILGNVCQKCGFSDKRALKIDHINSDGRADRKTCRNTYYKHVIEGVEKGYKKYQLLCANCNWIKVREKREYKNAHKIRPISEVLADTTLQTNDSMVCR